MDKKLSAEAAVYEIRVKGLLGQRWCHWFDGMTLTPQPDQRETVLTGVVIDQAALYGLLNRIRDLGLPLVALKKIEGEHTKGVDR